MEPMPIEHLRGEDFLVPLTKLADCLKEDLLVITSEENCQISAPVQLPLYSRQFTEVVPEPRAG